MRIGILGGSFDPVHNGHIYMAKMAYEHMKLDEVWLIPSYTTPNKQNKKMVTSQMRYDMCVLAVKDYPYMKVSDFEIQRQEISYTYLTVTTLKEQYPQHEFYFIMGADSIAYFDAWRHPEIISSCCEIIVINRNEFTFDELNILSERLHHSFQSIIHIVNCPKFDISSTQIREKLSNGIDCGQFINDEVLQFIRQYNLYEN